MATTYKADCKKCGDEFEAVSNIMGDTQYCNHCLDMEDDNTNVEYIDKEIEIHEGTAGEMEPDTSFEDLYTDANGDCFSDADSGL